MSVISAFPRRPLTLSSLPSTRIGWQPLLGLLLFAAVIVGDVAYFVPSLVDDLWPRASIETASQATLDKGSTCRARIVISYCDFEVTFRAGGATPAIHHKAFHYLMLLDKVDNRLPLQVFYDPSNPDRASMSWGQALLVNRLISQIVALSLLLGIFTVYPLSYWRSQRLRRSFLAMATAPRPVVAQFIGVRPGRYFATIRFAWTDPETGAQRRDSSRLPGTAQPFWLDGQRQTILALAGPDGHAHALDERLAPAVLSDEERRAVTAALA